MTIKIPTSLTIPLEKKGLTFRFVTKVANGQRLNVCEIRTRDTNQLVLSESAPNPNDALRKAVQACDAVPKPLRDDEARRKVAEQERQIRELQEKLASAQVPAPVNEQVQADGPNERGRRKRGELPCETC